MWKRIYCSHCKGICRATDCAKDSKLCGGVCLSNPPQYAWYHKDGEVTYELTKPPCSS